MENKREKILLIVAGVLLVLGILFFAGNKIANRIEEKSRKDLDITSKLVQDLYKKIANDQEGYTWSLFWPYTKTKDLTNFDKVMYDFDVKTADESIKMSLLNLSDKIEKISCNELGNNEKIDNEPGYTKCNKEKYGDVFKSIDKIEPKNVEEKYKDLYGSDAKLDLNTPIIVSLFDYPRYVYNPNVKKYLKYEAPVGGTFGPGGYKTKIKEAYQEDDKLYIIQEVKYAKYDEEGKTIIEEKAKKFKYTFAKDKNNSYKYESRKVVK